MNYSNKILSQTVTQLCQAKDIDHIVISPGSRNAPLTIGFTENDYFKNFSIVDERCAAFFALGLAQQLQKPVALVCTSGSALLNYYPAIAEAFYSDIPLVVISADRPQHLIDVGDGQTIRQENVYANHILYSANCVEDDRRQEYNETEINLALNKAIELKGPVHINIPFSEPLYDTTKVLDITPKNIHPQPTRAKLNAPVETKILGDIDSFRSKWNKSKRKMILIGVLSPEEIHPEYLKLIANDATVLVLTETTSNVHIEDCVCSIDQIIAPLTEEEFEALQPEILLTLGGMIVSKKIKAFLRKYPPKMHWHIDRKTANDTFFVLKHHFKVRPNTFFKALLTNDTKIQGDYQPQWLSVKEKRLTKHRKYLEEIPFSDFKVFDHLLKTLPSKIMLQLSNSATVRYAQLFPIKPSIRVYCNRGTSGIDGSTSTAIGASYASKQPTVFITGDLSFFYDSNALWNDYIPKTFRIIVINNRGGGIFRILPGAKNTANFGTFFETRHKLSAKQLCEMFGLEYTTASDEDSLSKTLHHFYEASRRPKLLEVFTPSEVNDTILLRYFDYIK